MKQLKFALYASLMLFAFLCTAEISLAQGPGDTDDADQTDVPIDGGVSLLIGAAAVYGAKKLKDKGNRGDANQIDIE